MLKKSLFVLLTSLIIVSCGNNAKKSEENKAEIIKTTVITVADFEVGAGELAGKPVEITAMVNHVCQHGGKRMFLVSNDSEETVKIVTGEKLASFNTDLEGYTIKVKGIVDELVIDEEYLLEWENELIAELEREKSEAEHDGEGGHEGSSKGEEADMGEHISGMEKIENFRQQIADSGTDHLSFYSIICEKYEKIETEKKTGELAGESIPE